MLLPVDVLNNLSALFARLPDDHYRLYYVEQGVERMIMDVVVRRGKPIDPTDDSEGTQDRPPTAHFERVDDRHDLTHNATPAELIAPVAIGGPEGPALPTTEDATDAALTAAATGALELPLAISSPEANVGVVFKPVASARYRALLVPAVAAVAASSAWAGCRWALHVDQELACASDDALSKSARLRRRLRRMLDGHTDQNRFH